jgi:hypothetical protein
MSGNRLCVYERCAGIGGLRMAVSAGIGDLQVAVSAIVYPYCVDGCSVVTGTPRALSSKAGLILHTT